jgi:hypothetical protein
MLRSLSSALVALTCLAAAGCSPGTPTAFGGASNDGEGGASSGTTTGAGGSGGGAATGGGGGAGGSGRCEPKPEICDGLDNDCNGKVDEGCACHLGQEQDCYTGPAATKGVGACKVGKQSCDEKGQWGDCQGEVVPDKEACNGVDDDCNGKVDDLPEQSCGVGACAATMPSCDKGKPVICTPGIPQQEICNGIDDNCNQLVDETFPGKDGPCDTGQQGVCKDGTLQCITENGETGPKCAPKAEPSAEVCNGVDDDCNGVVDDVPGVGKACSTGLAGPCAAGALGCSNGALVCLPAVPPVAEVCDGVDNDCNGLVDDGDPGGGGACATGIPGVCSAGTMSCTNGALLCTQNVAPSVEVCDGLDNDCNGVVDDGAAGGGGACSTGLPGVCAAGTMACQNGVLSCKENVAPKAEICGNGLDDDCNGVVDDGCAAQCAHDVCLSGVALKSGCSACVTKVCAQDSFCCSTQWDSLCVSEVPTYCGQSCQAPFTCSHALCSAGAALQSGCDAGQGNCVATVCGQDSFCCATQWDSLCVGEVTTYCGKSCP